MRCFTQSFGFVEEISLEVMIHIVFRCSILRITYNIIDIHREPSSSIARLILPRPASCLGAFQGLKITISLLHIFKEAIFDDFPSSTAPKALWLAEHFGEIVECHSHLLIFFLSQSFVALL